MSGYILTVTDDDLGAVNFASGRYEWADCMITHGLDEAGVHEIPEHVAWELRESFRENGMEFCIPCLGEHASLMTEFLRLEEEIV